MTVTLSRPRRARARSTRAWQASPEKARRLSSDPIVASQLEAKICQASTTQQWGEKGSWWIYGGTSIYSHTIPPNLKACDHLDDSHQDVRGSVTTVPASSYHPGGVNVVLADGSVRFIKSSVNYLTWYALATQAGGEVISSDQY